MTADVQSMCPRYRGAKRWRTSCFGVVWRACDLFSYVSGHPRAMEKDNGSGKDLSITNQAVPSAPHRSSGATRCSRYPHRVS